MIHDVMILYTVQGTMQWYDIMHNQCMLMCKYIIIHITVLFVEHLHSRSQIPGAAMQEWQTIILPHTQPNEVAKAQ